MAMQIKLIVVVATMCEPLKYLSGLNYFLSRYSPIDYILIQYFQCIAVSFSRNACKLAGELVYT